MDGVVEAPGWLVLEAQLDFVSAAASLKHRLVVRLVPRFDLDLSPWGHAIVMRSRVIGGLCS